MWLRIEPRLPKPVYQQVVDGIKESIAKGVLDQGDKLPSVRDLAAMMTLNPNTVAKAYRELEHERVIEVFRGRGTFVASPAEVPDRNERIEKMSDTMKQLLIEAHHLQMTEADVWQLMQQVMNEWNTPSGGAKA